MMTHNLSNAVTTAHFHGVGPHGASLGSLASIDVTGKMHSYSGMWSPMNSSVMDALTGKSMYGDVVYVNIHTAMYTNGEIRGMCLSLFFYECVFFCGWKDSFPSRQLICL